MPNIDPAIEDKINLEHMEGAHGVPEFNKKVIEEGEKKKWSERKEEVFPENKIVSEVQKIPAQPVTEVKGILQVPKGAIDEYGNNRAIQLIEDFIEFRKQFIIQVNDIFVEGKDYHVIQGKKSMAKGGAEKIASILKFSASFIQDKQAIEMLGNMPGLVAFKCELHNGDRFLGEGRGAALLSKNAGDPNKTLKMAQKSAFIDAVLRTSGLSDFFTQDLEDMPKGQIGDVKKETNKPTPKQLKYIADLAKKNGLSKDNLEKIMNTYKTASQVIAYLKSLEMEELSPPDETPVIQVEE